MGRTDDNKAALVAAMLDRVVLMCVTNKLTISGKSYNMPIIRRGLDRIWERLWPLDRLPDGRVVDFCVYQLFRFRDMIEQYPHTRWELTWCFSDNAVEKYRAQFMSNNGKSGINYYIDRWLSEGGLTRDALAAMLGDPRSHRLEKFIYVEAEERTKLRFHNKETGRALCAQSTTGWSPMSAACQECVFADECRDRFTRLMPELMRLRKQTNSVK